MANERLSNLYLRLLVIVAVAAFMAAMIWQRGIPLGLDLQGGSELQYRIRTDDLSEGDKVDVTQRTIDVIRRRVNPDGSKEIDIREQGRFRFYLQMPGMKEDEARRIEELIHRSGKLRFCLVNANADDMALARQGERVPGHSPFIPVARDSDGRPQRWRLARYDELKALSESDARGWLLVENRTDVTGEFLDDVRRSSDQNGFPAVGFSFRGIGRRNFEHVTEANKGRQLAIVLDRDLYSAPLITTRISGDGIIEGRFTEKEVEDLLVILRAGKLPADIELERNYTVGAQLGEDSIRSGVRSSLIAFALVIVFMAVYYRTTGVVADVAMLLNLGMVLGLMALLRSTLTLPGIAGLVLSLAMGVDANVLINERIREERERGKTLGLAIRTGYERALITILDSNLTTLITALILFGVGTGPVKGFALALSYGIVISMITSVWVTRVIVDLLVEHGWLKDLHMVRLLTKVHIPFSRIRYLTMAGSAILIVIGLSVLSRGWERVKDTDLTGGIRAEMRLSKGVSLQDFRARVNAIFPGKSDVQAVWDAEAQGKDKESPRRFSVRVRRLDDTERLPKMQGDLTAALAKAGLQPVIKPAQTMYEFDIELGKAADETMLRNLFADAGYPESSVRQILARDVRASEFNVLLKRSRLEHKPDERIAQVLDALRPILAEREVRITLGARQEERTEESGGQPAARRRFVPVKLSDAATVAAVREAIIRDVFAGQRPGGAFRVESYGADKGAEMCREAAVYGDEETLDRLLASKKDTLTVLQFHQPGGAELRVFTKSPQGEHDVRGRLAEARVLDELVRAVVPAGADAAGKKFAVKMEPLSEEKCVEYIRTRMLGAFQEELASEQAKAALVPLADPPALADIEALRSAGYAFYALKLDRPVQVQSVLSTLSRAGFRDAPLASERSGAEVVKAVQEMPLKLKGGEDVIAEARERIAFAFANPDPFLSMEVIGPAVASMMQSKAILAIFLSWAMIIFYMWFRFGELKWGVAGVVALIHDVLMTAGAVGMADALSGTLVGQWLGFSEIKVNLSMIAAFLTLIGYSINDTIVVFDRIRENLGGVRRRVDAGLVDGSINQTLSRTVLTSVIVVLVLGTLYVTGGPVIHGFAFVMLFGAVVGTYSSVFIASPIVLDWDRLTGLLRGGATTPAPRKS